MPDFTLLDALAECARENRLPVYRIAMFQGNGMYNQVIWADRAGGYTVAWQAYDPDGQMGGLFAEILDNA